MRPIWLGLAFGWLASALTTGITLAQPSAGILLDTTGPVAVVAVAAALMAFAAVLSARVLPEHPASGLSPPGR